jgi:hypothetical protein
MASSNIYSGFKVITNGSTFLGDYGTFLADYFHFVADFFFKPLTIECRSEKLRASGDDIYFTYYLHIFRDPASRWLAG